MLNFDYLKDNIALEPLYRFCDMAEQRQTTEPEVSALNARRALDWIVKSVYEMKGERVGERASLFELTDGATFRDFINDPEVMKAVHWVRKVGNRAAHDGSVGKTEAYYSLVNIYNVVKAIMLKLRRFDSIPDFDRSLVPERPRRQRILVSRPAAAAPAKADDSPARFAASVGKEVVEAAPEVAATLSWSDIDEAETRRLLIDLMIREAGWEILPVKGARHPAKACIEVEVSGMPSAGGKGFADYVLFGDDGRPLAVIEAKRSSVDPLAGEQQASLYADCLEREYGVRPAIYFTNGYETWLVDGIGYPKRRVYAFHSREDLLWLHQQRKRKDITDMSVKDSISNRHYQKTAIKQLCEHFNARHRRGLLVMATGTGKTRTAISLVDVLQRAGWVKNTLFLADRTSLVRQAHRNFVKLMPEVPTAVLSDKDSHPDLNARITFSTYQTMINHIDADVKTFSVGRFDLIIIDEAHRSVFGKYGAIFHYFDSLLVGLTATPRDQVDRSTYDLLQLEGGVPNFAYELGEAVADGYLVPPVGLKRDSEVINDGIRYNSLSAAEKEQLEKVWEYEAATNPGEPALPRDIRSREIYEYIFNTRTIDLVLQNLMANGLKVDSGEKIGKAIIFAFSSQHAQLIVDRFNLLYPALGPDFCRQIDYSVKFSQSLIDRFSQRDSLPQIAVSVDMLDTGIDVPDVLNLVFFKRVRSRIKFMQMIGRGTRLCPGIFGPGRDKKEFYIFDYCGNFNYFETHINEPAAPPAASLTERLFGVRADIAYCLQAPEYQGDEFARRMHDSLKATLRAQVEALPDSHISVRANWEAVRRFRAADTWKHIRATDVLEMKNKVAPLVSNAFASPSQGGAGEAAESVPAYGSGPSDDEKAKKFDLLALYVQLSMVDSSFVADRYEERIRTTVDALRGLAAIPSVGAKMGYLNEVMSPGFWQNKSLSSIERMRLEVRDLLKYLSGDVSQTFEVDIDDRITDGGIASGFVASVTYRQKVLDFLEENRELPVLTKIKNIEQLTAADIAELERILWQELGSKDDYLRFLSRENLADSCAHSVAAFIRTIVKVDRPKALQLFTAYISENSLSADQEEYLKSILDYVCENGDMQTAALVNESPFDEINVLDLFPGKFRQVADFVTNLHNAITAA